MSFDIVRRLQRTNKDQNTLTMPKQLMQLLGWDERSVIEFSFEGGKISISLQNEKNGKLARKLQCTNKGQYILTVPKNIVQLLSWHDKDLIYFLFDSGKLTISKGGAADD